MIETLESRLLLSAHVTNNVLIVTGTAARENITIARRGQLTEVHTTVGPRRTIESFNPGDFIRRIQIDARGGNDHINIDANIRLPSTIDAGPGNDLIRGGPRNDLILGGTGHDRIYGNNGRDTLTGGTGADLLSGGAGDDSLSAGDGQSDTLIGGGGDDQASFDAGADSLLEIERLNSSGIIF